MQDEGSYTDMLDILVLLYGSFWHVYDFTNDL